MVVAAVYRSVFYTPWSPRYTVQAVGKVGVQNWKDRGTSFLHLLLWIAYYIRKVDWYVGFWRRKLKLWGDQCAQLINDRPVIGARKRVVPCLEAAARPTLV